MERAKFSQKKCKKCGENKPLSDYCKHNQTKDGLHIYCKACRKIDAKKFWRLYWKKNKQKLLDNAKKKRENDKKGHAAYRRMLYNKNPDRNRNQWYKTKYNITLQKYEEMYYAQNGKCLICGKFKRKLSIDHNHITKIVRGLLCRECNIGLGLFKDNLISLQNAIKYLQNGTEKTS